MGKMAFVFPGQGTQYVGMGRAIYDAYEAARAVFDLAETLLPFDVKASCFEGPASELLKTEIQQPTIHTTEIALLRVVQALGIQPDITAGFSLGEYAALVFAGVLRFEDTVTLVGKRGKFMQEAVPLGRGKMVAISGLEREQVFEVVKRASEVNTIECSNFNCPGQIIISGYAEAVDRAKMLADAAGAAHTVYLDVSGPFHTSLLIPAGQALRKELDQIPISAPKIPYISNVTAQVYAGESIADLLEKHVSMPVLWEDTLATMLGLGVDTFVEIGPKKMLSNFILRTAERHGKQVTVFSVETPEEIEALAKALKS